MVIGDPSFLTHCRLRVQRSMIDYTQYFFRETQHRNFVTNFHHEQICNLLDRVIRGEVVKAMINIGPRYGKTELVVKNFVSRCLSINAAARFIHLSYSDDLALDNSEGIKSIVEHESYQALFPEVQIRKDSKAKKKWYTTAGGGVYATSTAGQVTGFGSGRVDEEVVEGRAETEEERIERELDEIYLEAGIDRKFGGALIIDDPIKPEDGDSDIRRERINARYDSTIKNRVNSRRTPIIIIMQRVHENDLCGYLLANEPGEWEVLSIPCIQEDENGGQYALWPFKHTLEELLSMQMKNPLVFGRQYMQQPMPAGGFLYPYPFKTYQVVPISERKYRKNYTDTADLGSDHLCAIAYVETELGIYVLDVIYTQAGMEITEPMVAKQLHQYDVDKALVESNNGGRGFARNVEAQTRLLGNLKTRVEWFHQSENKYTRIFTNAATVQNLVHFPADWETRWTQFAKHLKTYMAVGNNQHDDAEDAVTGMVENFGKNLKTRVLI